MSSSRYNGSRHHGHSSHGSSSHGSSSHGSSSHGSSSHGSSSHGSSSRGSRRAQESTASLISSLNGHLYTTLTDLCRVERSAPPATDPEEDQRAFSTAMTAAWKYHVTSNNLLNELRQLTTDYPFSSACVDYAKWAIETDPNSNRSWNFVWLVLVKIKNEGYVESYASGEAASPDMWGGRTPSDEEAKQLAACFAYSWNAAMNELLRHWPTPPTTTGH